MLVAEHIKNWRQNYQFPNTHREGEQNIQRAVPGETSQVPWQCQTQQTICSTNWSVFVPLLDLVQIVPVQNVKIVNITFLNLFCLFPFQFSTLIVEKAHKPSDCQRVLSHFWKFQKMVEIGICQQHYDRTYVK
jgi:hypothetical protein